MMNPEPAPEHRWLGRLVGRWEVTTEAGAHGPAPPPWTETVRTLGGLWSVAQSDGSDPESGTPTTTMMTLGFDIARETFVGSFVGSMMDTMWIYDRGTLDPAADALTLECDGPDFGEPGRITRWKDIIAFDGDDRRTLTALMQAKDGSWSELMTARYRRIG